MLPVPRRRLTHLATLTILVLATTIRADEPPSKAGAAHLESFDALQKKLGTPGLRLLDVRPRDDYQKAHLPGAVWVNVKAASALAVRPGGLNDRDAWAAWLAPLAIGLDVKEVRIADGDRQLEAARVWWLLTYLGVPDVGLIDGNVPLWEEQGRPTVADVPEFPPSAFPVKFRRDRLATKEDVLSALESKSAKVVDARSVEEHTGDRAVSKRGGHIPTACHLEWTELVGKDGRFLTPDALRARLSKLGVPADTTVITHCQGGGRASVDAFNLERLGLSTRNYYLGWSDWGNADETPVATGREDGRDP